MYRGVRLAPVVMYSVCVDLEAAISELDWNNDHHRQQLRRWYAIARDVIDELHTLFARRRPIATISLQGHFVSAAVARQLAVTYGFQSMATEVTFHPPRMILEPLTGVAVNRTAAALYFRQREDIMPHGRYVPWMDAFLSGLDAAKIGHHASPSARFSWPEGRKRILFLGQCYTDSSVLFGARDGATAVSILRVLLHYVSGRDAFLLAKLHPKENGGTDPLENPYNRLTWRKLNGDPEIAARLIDRDEEHWGIDDSNRFGTTHLLRECDVVVTINSQGGLEALAHGREVVLLGDAFYSGLGFTFDVPRLALLPAVLDAMLWGGISLADRDAFARFLFVYFQHYCIERTPAGFVRALRTRLWPRGQFQAAFELAPRSEALEPTRKGGR